MIRTLLKTGEEGSLFFRRDWNYDEDRSRIRNGYGPENISRLRRFAIGVIKSKGVSSVAQKMRQLTCKSAWFLITSVSLKTHVFIPAVDEKKNKFTVGRDAFRFPALRLVFLLGLEVHGRNRW